MKLCLVTLIALVRRGCEDVSVLSTDGMQVLTYCNGLNWVECANKACPDGFYDIKGTDVIRCKP